MSPLIFRESKRDLGAYLGRVLNMDFFLSNLLKFRRIAEVAVRLKL